MGYEAYVHFNLGSSIIVARSFNRRELYSSLE